jgi:hypothetical protein
MNKFVKIVSDARSSGRRNPRNLTVLDRPESVSHPIYTIIAASILLRLESNNAV